jgi:RimJ/RimL family protein N-acetyltransferase
MITPLSRTHLPQLNLLLAQHAARWGLPAPTEHAWCVAASGSAEHLWGRWQGGALVGALRMVPGPRARNRHTATLELVGDDQGLLATAVDLADRWTPIDRLDLSLPLGHEAVSAAQGLGFDPEVTLRRAPDEVVLGRLRPGFVARPPGPPPPWPPRHRRPAPAWGWRRMEDADVPAVAALSVEATAIWGTLQTPSSSLDFYLDRHHATPPDNFLGVLTADGAVAGIGGMHPTGRPDARVLGMAVGADWQGCGGGAFLMDALIHHARADGVRRLELAVWADNTRARALYERAGFVAEGTRRFDGIRDGGHASSLEMARELR